MGTIDKLDQGLEDVAGLVELAIEAEDEDTFHEAQAEQITREKLEQLPQAFWKRPLFPLFANIVRIMIGKVILMMCKMDAAIILYRKK